MPEDVPMTALDRAERRDRNRGYREGRWAGFPNYECIQEPCWMGTYSRASTLDEAEMQEHQARFHRPAATAP